MTAFDNIRLEKGLYASGDFTGALEKIDPSENYSGTALEGLDAYQRQLKRFDIKVSGAGSDVVDKFFKTSDSARALPRVCLPRRQTVCRRQMSCRASSHQPRL